MPTNDLDDLGLPFCEVSSSGPEFLADTADRSVAENTAGGENIGDPVAATDADEGDMLTYTLGGADAVSFDIDSATGQLMTKAALDFETKASYTVEVTATDSAGESDTVTVTITVTNVGLDNPYDENDDGTIERDEVIAAINDYLFGVGDAAISKGDVIRLINLYLFG